MTCIDYSPGDVLAQEIDDPEAFLGSHRPDWSVVRWINVAGLSDMGVIHALATKYELHPLAVEDLLYVRNGPRSSLTAAMTAKRAPACSSSLTRCRVKEQSLHSEQVSIFLGHKTVLTFQESRNDVWEPIRQRISAKGSRLRSSDAGFLMYSLLDAIIDRCFPILESYGDRMEELEIPHPRALATRDHQRDPPDQARSALAAPGGLADAGGRFNPATRAP